MRKPPPVSRTYCCVVIHSSTESVCEDVVRVKVGRERVMTLLDTLKVLQGDVPRSGRYKVTYTIHTHGEYIRLGGSTFNRAIDPLPDNGACCLIQDWPAGTRFNRKVRIIEE